jgi:murein DD-endopeptidase MepM/ murein hydrolase activator NlpD
MSFVGRAAPSALMTTVLFCGVAPPLAHAGGSGGAQAPSEAQTGGSEYGVRARVLAARRPTVSELSLPRTAAAGRPPRVALRIDETGVGTVEARITVVALSSHRAVITVAMGWVHTGRTLTVSWPAHATLTPGGYQVSVSAHDHHTGTLARGAHRSGEASLTVRAPAKPPAKRRAKRPAERPAKPPPPPVPPPAPSPPAPALEAGVPAPAQTAAAGAVFPVAGPHSYGGPEDRFGAPRGAHVHQGQDVLTSEGTPVLAPLAGTILTTSYQAGGAGYYAVLHTGVGFDLMFAHCEAESLSVGTGQVVAAGQLLCKAGETGDATAPHLHFEMWVGGWQSPTGHSIDPLPYLEAWDHTAAGG